MADPSVRELVDAVLTVLAGTGFNFYDDGDIPATPSFPYGVVYSVGELEARSGPMSGPNEDGTWEIQVTSVGETREQAQGLGDLVRSTVTRTALSVSGRQVNWVDPSHEGGDRDDDRNPSLFYSIDVLAVGTTPA